MLRKLKTNKSKVALMLSAIIMSSMGAAAEEPQKLGSWVLTGHADNELAKEPFSNKTYVTDLNNKINGYFYLPEELNEAAMLTINGQLVLEKGRIQDHPQTITTDFGELVITGYAMDGKVTYSYIGNGKKKDGKDNFLDDFKLSYAEYAEPIATSDLKINVRALTHFVSVQGGNGSNGTNEPTEIQDQGNFNNDGASQLGSIAIGSGARATNYAGVAIGLDAVNTGSNSVVIGSNATIPKDAGYSDVVIGHNATVLDGGRESIAIGSHATIAVDSETSRYPQSAIAIGTAAVTRNSASTAIGVASRSEGVNSLAMNGGHAIGGSSIAIGSDAKIPESIVLENDATAYSFGSIAIGVGTQAGHEIKKDEDKDIKALAIGNHAKAESDGAVAIGFNSNAKFDNSVAIGNQVAAFSRGVAIGDEAKAYGNDSIAIRGNVSAHNAIAIGNGTSASGNGNVVIGNRASDWSDTNMEADKTVIGAKAMVAFEGGVALGAKSFSARSGDAKIYPGYNPATDDFGDNGGDIDKTVPTFGAVAIGTELDYKNMGLDRSIQRQLTGLAAGTKDNDAVNVAQLKALAKAVKQKTGSSSTVSGKGIVNVAKTTTDGVDNYEVSVDTSTIDAKISANSKGVADNKAAIATNASDITALKTDVASAKNDLATVKADSTANKGDLAKVKSDLETAKTDISTLKTDVTTNKTAIEGNTTNITNLTSKVETNTKDIKGLTTKVETNETGVKTNADEIAKLKTGALTSTTAIDGLSKKVDKNTADIATNKTDIATNKTAIDGLTTKVETNTTDIGTLKTEVKGNTDNITKLKTDVDTNKTNIATNTSDISKVKTDVESNKTAITSNTGEINKVKDELATVKTGVETNKTTIVDLGTKVTNNTDEITKVKESVAGNTTNITNLTTKLDGISTDIETVKNSAKDIVDLKDEVKGTKAQVEKNTSNINGTIEVMDNVIKVVKENGANIETVVNNVDKLEDKVDDSNRKTESTLRNLTKTAVLYNTDKQDIITLGGKNGTAINNLKATEITQNSNAAVTGGQLYTTNVAVKQNASDIEEVKKESANTVKYEEDGSVTLRNNPKDSSKGTVIKNVEGGKIAKGSKEAINGDQLYQLNQNIAKSIGGLYVLSDNLNNFASSINSRMKHLENRIDNLKEGAYDGIASAVAMANMPSATYAGQNLFNVGVGSYKGYQAVSVGLARLSENRKVSFKASVSLTSNGNKAFGAGVGFAW